MVFARVVKAVDRARARGGVVQGEVGQRVGLLPVAPAQGGPGGDGVACVVLGAQGGVNVALVGIRPGLGEVGLHIRRRGHVRHARERDVGARLVQAVVLPADVGGDARAAAAPVQPQRGQREFGFFMVNGRAALAARQVQADAAGLLRPEAARHIQRGLLFAAAARAQLHARKRLVGRALGQQIERAAQAPAAGRRAIEKGRCASQHFHALEQLGGDVLARQQAIQAVVGRVVRADDEAAHEIRLLKIAKAARHAHAGVVLQHIAHAARLPVGNQLAGVAGDGKRRVHRILRAQQPHARAARHLPAGIGARQAFGRGIGAGAHRHGLQRGVIRGIVRFGAGLGLGGQTGRQGGQGQRAAAQGRGVHGMKEEKTASDANISEKHYSRRVEKARARKSHAPEGGLSAGRQSLLHVSSNVTDWQGWPHPGGFAALPQPFPAKQAPTRSRPGSRRFAQA